MKKILPVLIAAIFLFAAVGLFSQWKPGAAERTTREVALTCTTDMATEFHIHPTLKIIIKGEEVGIPSNVGITPTCMMALHTHTPDGIIHVESPEKRDFTLGDFFAVWEKEFNETQILSYVANDKFKVTMTVNGEVVDTYENTILRDKDEIVITYAE